MSRTWMYATVAMAVLALLYVAPILGSGATEFDAQLYEIHAFQAATGASALSAIGTFATAIQHDRGAFLPLSAIQPLFWLIVPNLVVAKLVQAGLVSLDVAALCFFVSLLSRSAALGMLSGIGTLLSLEFRKPHDAVLGSTIALPTAVGLVLLSLIAYQLFVRTSRRSWLVFACITGVASSLLNEAATLLVWTFVVVDVAGFGSRRLGSLLVTLSASCIFAISVIRNGLPASFRWVAAGNARGLHDAAVAFVAVFPNSYRAFGNVVKDGVPGYFADTRFESIPKIDLLGLAVALLATVAAYAFSTNALSRVDSKPTISLSGVAALWVLVGVVVHDPGQWSSALPIGEAYSSSYVGCFGFGIAFALTIRGMQRITRSRRAYDLIPVGVALFVFAELYGNTRVNAKVIDFDRDRYESLRLVDQAARDGLFGRLPKKSLVAFDGIPPLPLGTAIGDAELRGILDPGNARGLRITNASALHSNRDGRQRWVIHRELRGVRSGALSVAHVASTSDELAFDRALLYRNYPSMHDRVRDASRFEAPVSGITMSSASGDGNSVIELVRRACGVAPLNDLYEPEQPTLSYAQGFFRPDGYKRWNFWVTNYLTGEDDSQQDWRYGAERAVLEIHPDRCRHQQIAFSAWVFSVGAGFLTIDAPGDRRKIAIWDTGRPINLRLQSEPAKVLRVAFSTNAPSAKEVFGYPNFVGDELGPARLVLATARVTASQEVRP